MKEIRNNLISLALGQSISFAINFVTILLAARSLGVASFGEFASLLAVVTIVSKIVDFGLGPILFRELSERNIKPNIFYNVIALKIILVILVFIILNATILILDFAPAEILLCDILFLNIIISSKMANFREVLAIPFKATLQMHIPMSINILDNILLLIYVIVLSFHGLSLNYFILGYVLSNFPGFIFLLYYLRKKFNYKLLFRFDIIKWIILESLPLAGYVLLMVIYQQADIVLIKNINGTFYTGIYSAAARLAMPLNIIPETLVISIFPFIVKHRGEKKYGEKIATMFKILFFISFLFAIVFTFKSVPFIKLTFGEKYLDSAMPAIILLWSQVFLFFSFLGSDLLIAYNSQKWNFVYAILIVSANLLLNLILLPHYNFVGAGLSKLGSSFFGALFLAFVLRKEKINYFIGNVKVILWMLIMIIALFFLSLLPLYLYILVVLICIFITLRYYLFFDYDEVVEIAKTLSLQKWVFKIFRMN